MLDQPATYPRCARPLLAILLVLLSSAGLTVAAEPPVAPDHAARMLRGQELFTRHVRPVLTQRCVKCHGGDKTKGEFDLTTREGLLRGGTQGTAVVPGKTKSSLLYKLITHQAEPHMPDRAPQLPAEQIARIAEWIDLGAPYDRPLLDKPEKPARKPLVVTDADRQFWSFRPLTHPAIPAVKNPGWCRTPIDHFILAQLEEKPIAPNPPVDRRKLLRRAYFDVLGLPPEPEEVDAFVRDPSPEAYASRIDRLLDNPHFGERWARHWLDLARFAESHGFEHDSDRPNAYTYRDFVIKALNRDLPFNTFVKWQIAGDELEPDNPLALMATGFLAAGVHSTQITKNQVEKERYDELDDMGRTLGTAMLGLTVGCARCHDHKYDPIPTRDYYRLIAAFTTTVRSDLDVNLDPGANRPGQAGPKPAPKTVKALVCSEGVPPLRLHSQGEDFFQQAYFLKRGDPNQKDGVAPAGFLQVLMRTPEQEKHWSMAPPKGWRTSYRRHALAEWVTDVDAGAGNLLARVIVNRLWQHYQGRGIVGTPSDFGFQGERPTHPELLDWLAGELIRNGWRLKPIHKLILTSAVYRQRADYDEQKGKCDRDNRLCWRRSPKRLEAEIIRDALLAVSGQLDYRMFGPGTLDENQKRRSIYFFVKRSKLIPMMVLFDAPDALQGIERRPTTTIAPQALLLMNNPAVRGYAESFARRADLPAGAPLADVVRRAYEIALARPPSTEEQVEAVQFIEEQMAEYQADGKGDARQRALADFCQVVMGLNEFIYID
jgi:mono/diheme cytochrome c family protein